MVGGIRLITYDRRVTRRCGASSHGASVVAAPPRLPRDSSTSVLAPERARYAAETNPLWPPPITIASYEFDMWTSSRRGNPTFLTDCSI